MNLKQGTQLQGGRYRIEKVLGQGGFGITYLGVQTSLDDKVAIKEFFMKEHCNRNAGTSQVTVGSTGSYGLVENFRNKFIKEARNIRKLRHHNIVNIIDVFEENGTAYYVMEYLEGGNLDSRVKSNGPLDEATAVACIRQVADALAEVHSNKLLHLDLKPENIMLNGKGEAVLIDFGIAKHYDNSGAQTTSGLVGLSDGYAPMEQYKKGGVSSFSPATDIYSLGATLFRLITGNKPPHASDVNDDGLPALPDGISPAVRGAIEAAMQPKRKERPQSIKEFLALLAVSGSVTPLSADAETKITVEEATVIESPVAEPLHVEPQSVALTAEKDANVKWIDFAQFCDYNGHSLKKMKFYSMVKKLAIVSWCGVLLAYISRIVILNALLHSGHLDDYHNWSIATIVAFFFFLVLAVICSIMGIFNRYFDSTSLSDIQDSSSKFKLIRNKERFIGLSLWNKNKSKMLLGMKYENISRINDDTFVCTCNGFSGVYNATKRKMVVPVKCENIEVKDNRIHATCDGVVTVYTDKGYRVVE